jgi:ribonuclease HII
LAGVDEVGRGCLAGPVVAACVIYPTDSSYFPQVADSKLLSPARREKLYDEICATAAAWAIAKVESTEIDEINIHQASLKAMCLAVEQVRPAPDYLLVDGKFPIDSCLQQQAVIGGDRQCQVIGAASILAKVWRDRLMVQYEADYPQFGFAQHKGYGTQQHRNELKQHGPTVIHRRSFKGVLPE